MIPAVNKKYEFGSSRQLNLKVVLLQRWSKMGTKAAIKENDMGQKAGIKENDMGQTISAAQELLSFN